MAEDIDPREAERIRRRDQDLDAEVLARKIELLIRDEARLRRLGRNARAFARVDAAQRIARSMEQLVHAGPVPLGT